MYFWMQIPSDYKINLLNGQIEGSSDTTIYGVRYYRFEGIPYAKPPLGLLRFKAPVPPEHWEGVLNCKKPGNKALQKNPLTGQIEGSEDCLYLNVYSKYYMCPRLLPVMVFIHGGSFLMGEASRDVYSPDYFMTKDIVLVTMNYRLCSLGFLSLKDKRLHVPGNAGLRDQIMALEWIKDNIIHFNGDAKNVTVFGMSAGAASVHYLMCSNLARNLFHKAIIMSGSVLNYWACQPQKDFAYRLAKVNGYDRGEFDDDILTFLQSLPAKALVDHFLMTNEEMADGHLFAFGPVVEPYGDRNTAVICAEPLSMLRFSWGNQIPIMIGIASFEGLVIQPWLKLHPQMADEIHERPELLLPPDVRNNMSKEFAYELGRKLLETHYNQMEDGTSSHLLFMDMMSYRIILLGVYRSVLSRVFRALEPTFLYRFDFDFSAFSDHRRSMNGMGSNEGVAHGDDLCYLFVAKSTQIVDKTSDVYKTIQRMIGMWTTFAMTSNPNCPEMEHVVWEPLKSNHLYRALNIGKALQLVELPERTKLEAWNTCYAPEDLY